MFILLFFYLAYLIGHLFYILICLANKLLSIWETFNLY